MSPTARSKQYLEQQGYRVAIVERWNAYARCRQDLYNCIDILAIKDGLPLLAVQCTSGANHAARVAKIGPFAQTWASTGNLLEVWSWRKAGPRGQRKTWQVRRERV